MQTETDQATAHHDSHHAAFNYNHIADGIYVGTNQCCVVTLSDLLKKEEVSADISLEGERVDQPFGIEIFMWVPVPDHGVPTREQLTFAVETLERLVAQKRKVYIHCKNGHGRSGTLTSAYLMKTRGLSYEDAFEIIKTQRPGSHMQEQQIAFVKSFAWR